MKKRIFICSLFITVFNIFSQESKEKSRTISEIGNSICSSTKIELFCKTNSFFRNQEYDSCYIYSEKALNLSVKVEQKDFFNYLQAYSALIKGFNSKVLLHLNKISDSREYVPLKLSLYGYVYLQNKEYDKAVEKYEKLIRINSFRNKEDLKDTYNNLALCYLHKKNYQKADVYFSKRGTLIKEEDTVAIIRAKLDVGNLYYDQYLDDKAIPLFEEAYDLARNYSSLKLKKDAALNMAVVEENRKRYKESVHYYKEYDKWKDSIWNRDKIWELTEKDKQLAVAQKQKEIAVQDEQIKRQKVVQKGLLLGASGLLVFIGGLGYFYRKLKKQKQLITEQKEELDIANKTKNYLFSVVSHDLRSPINTIKRQHKKLAKHIANNDLSAIKEATQQAISVTNSTSHLLNNVLQWSLEQSNQLNFSQENYALQPIIEHILFDYEEVAESNGISIATNFTENITVKTDKESLKIVLRNLIDNAIKYMNGAGNITITTTTENNQARIELKDSGIGISEERLQKINALKDLSVDKIDRSKGVGLGLILCQTLIKKNNGTLFFESVEGKSTTAIVLLPLA